MPAYHCVFSLIARFHGEVAKFGTSRQQGRFAWQTVRRLRFADELAAALGKELVAREVLFRRLSSRQDSAWLSCVP